MKKLIAVLACLITSIACGATLVPIQLLNPTGSTAGEMLVSTGASGAPAWSNSATITGGSITGVPISGSTGAFTTITASSTITPSQTAGIVGTTTNNSAQAGSVGEFPSPTNLSNVSLTNSIPANASSMSLTPGDWDVSCLVFYGTTSTTNLELVISGISTTSGTLGAIGTYASYLTPGAGATGGNSVAIQSPTVRELLSSTTTVYCIADSEFTVSTLNASGFLRARRIR